MDCMDCGDDVGSDVMSWSEEGIVLELSERPADLNCNGMHDLKCILLLIQIDSLKVKLNWQFVAINRLRVAKLWNYPGEKTQSNTNGLNSLFFPRCRVANNGVRK
jgi:hypothetical protein